MKCEKKPSSSSSCHFRQTNSQSLPLTTTTTTITAAVTSFKMKKTTTTTITMVAESNVSWWVWVCVCFKPCTVKKKKFFIFFFSENKTKISSTFDILYNDDDDDESKVFEILLYRIVRFFFWLKYFQHAIYTHGIYIINLWFVCLVWNEYRKMTWLWLDNFIIVWVGMATIKKKKKMIHRSHLWNTEKKAYTHTWSLLNFYESAPSSWYVYRHQWYDMMVMGFFCLLRVCF